MDPVLERYDHLLSRFTADNFPPLIIAIGSGDPQLLEAIARRSAKTKVLAVDPVPMLPDGYGVSELRNAWIESGRLIRLVGPGYDGRTDAWRLIDRRMLNPPTLVSPTLSQEYPSEAAAAKAVVQQIILGAQSNDEARRRFSGPYLLNTIANLQVIATEGNAAGLNQLFDGMPAVVVGAGPSLDANLTTLQKIHDRVIIVAVDTAVRPLLAAGLRPHFVVGVDPSEDNARHLRDLPETRGAWFVAEPSLPPAVFAQFAGRTFIYKVSQHHPWPWLNAHGLDCGKLEAWGSVITTAFDLACRLGCDPIAFAGADLAYTQGLPYCRNTVYESEWQHLTTIAERAAVYEKHLSEKGTVKIPDLAGRETMSAPRFVQFRDWLVARAGREPGRRVVNATGAGILFGGRIEQAALRSLGLPKSTRSSEEIHQQIRSAWLAAPNRAGRLAAAVAALSAKQHEVVATWLQECGETASAEQIVGSLAVARQGVGRLSALRAFSSDQREYFDQHINGRENATDGFATDPSGHVAHVLLDYVQRTQSPAPGPLARIIEGAAAVPAHLRALDFGCSDGRAMEAMVKAGVRVDGIDFSERIIDVARQSPTLKHCEFFLSNGHDCGGAPDGAYDLVFSHACFQFIPVRGVRIELLRAIARALRPGGVVVIRFRFHPLLQSSKVPLPWAADDFTQLRKSELQEVWPTAEALPNIYRDFSRFFHDVRIQTIDVAPTGKLPKRVELVVSASTAEN